MDKENKYQAFLQEISQFVPQERIYTDELRRLAWGTDAGFYRLIPQIVIRSNNEQEISDLLRSATRHQLPVTFRAAGTSLSGQAISDSILIIAGKNWEKYSISPDHNRITLQPGIIGQRVNELLQPFGRKFAPDPASVKSAMIGGIVMNNASGMNCGTHANSDKMLLSARIILADGTLLDTGNDASKQAFSMKHAEFITQIQSLRDQIRTDKELSARIRYKYSIKNVTGLNLLPFITFDDPFDIITHLMVGSEGTLAFLSEVTMSTEYDYPHKASAMLYFKDIKEACRAVVALKKLTNEKKEWIVKGAELLDWKSLASVNDRTGEGLTAVLTETKAHSKEELAANIAVIEETLKPFNTYIPVHFTDKPEEYSKYWAIRSGIFPSVGGTRKPGTTSLIEDVAFHIEDLPEATADLQQLIARHGYDDACIYGHALEGNYHFIINQSFSTDAEVKRYEELMNDVKTLVIDKYDGSLKAEHGTGRNMAPFVKYEWGEKAYRMMQAVKTLFDPLNILNPGVIFNDDPQCHIKNFKPLPLLGSSHRQPAENNKSTPDIGPIDKCAGDGLCSTSCPMGINTGDLTHYIRQQELPEGSFAYSIGNFAANHFAGIKSSLRPMLTLANAAHTVLGTSAMLTLTTGMHNLLGIPQWTPFMPKSYKRREKGDLSREKEREESQSDSNTGSQLSTFNSQLSTKKKAFSSQLNKVVYFPSCINQTMGLPKKSREKQPLVDKMLSLLQKAGYEVIFPKDMEKLCCGTIWESKGMPDIADRKSAELEKALWEASEKGKYLVLCDQSPCLHRMREKIRKMKLYEPAEFIYTFLRDKLEFCPVDRPVAIHITCSMRRIGLADTLLSLARLCSTRVIVPKEVGCCGFAGDKGFTHPEVNSYALRKLRPQLEKAGIQTGYSNSRTCEIGLATHTGVTYVSIAYLVDECTKAR